MTNCCDNSHRFIVKLFVFTKEHKHKSMGQLKLDNRKTPVTMNQVQQIKFMKVT